MAPYFVAIYADRYFFPRLHGRKLYPIHAPGFRYTLKNRILAKLGLKQQFEEWFYALKRGERVVISSNALLHEKHLLKLLPYHQNMIIYFWDPVSSIYDYILKYKHLLNIYSHDRSDCEKYGFKFNTTCYHKINDIKPHEDASDMIFIGTTKNRLDIISEYYQKLENFRRCFHVYDYTGKIERPAGGPELHDWFMPYEDYLSRVLSSKALIDLMQHGQDSLTLRVMESLFYEKKLITTYQNITRESFYDPQNIMVVQSPDSIDEQALREFLDTPYRPVDPQLVAYYEYDNWIERFV